MASTIRCLNLILSNKGNKSRGYKWILALLKLKRLIKKIKAKKRGEGGLEWDCLQSIVSWLNI